MSGLADPAHVTRDSEDFGAFHHDRLLAAAMGMARPLRIHLPEVPCHVIARGNAKQRIFEDDTDYDRFLRTLQAAFARFGVMCLAYCLLPNHYHLLVVPGELRLSRAMQQLNSAYCQAFNRRHGRVGHVLQGRYTSPLVDSDEYLRNVIRYIALNPVKAGLVALPDLWKWGGYRAAAGLEEAPAFLAVDRVWKAFDEGDPSRGPQRLAAFVADSSAEPEPSRHQMPDAHLVLRIQKELEQHRNTPDFTYADRFAWRPSIEGLLEGVETHDHVREVARMAFLHCGYTLRQIGEAVGRPPATVWSWIHAFDRRRCIRQPGRHETGVRSRSSEALTFRVK